MSQELATTDSKAGTLRQMLGTYKAELAAALPRGISVDRMARIAMTSARKNPALLDCSPQSFLGAVIQSCQLGLEPDTPMGQAYLIPFFNSKTGDKEVNFMPGYRGLMDLVYRTADHPIIMPHAVYDCDRFEYSHGLTQKLDHSPVPRKPENRLTHVYAIASFKDGRKEFMVMDRPEIEAIRARSKAQKFSPWQTDYEAMAMKTVIRRMVKFLPMSAEIQTAVGLDDRAESGESQGNDDWLKAGKPIETKGERIEGKMSGNPDDFNNFK